MSRDITSAFNTAITSKVVRPLMAVELEFSDGTLRMWNGYGDITMTAGGSSQTFTGAGDLLGISEIEESDILSMSGVTLTLSGIKSSLISTALSAQYTNRNGAIYLGLFDTSANVIADVYTLFKGKMDVLNISEGQQTTMIQLKLESRLVSFEKASNRMYTLEDQKVDYSNDLGFEFIPDLQDKEIIWGKATN
jgi:hypothetical protein|tara:strand:- start:1049 stop:1627 length:579 start_codon:yes stop_codon:yes gene_type:complete